MGKKSHRWTDSDEDDEPVRSKGRERSIACAKRCGHFMINHVLLFFAVLGYCVGGVYLFQELEYDIEKEVAELKINQTNALNLSPEKFEHEVVQCRHQGNESEAGFILIKKCVTERFHDYELRLMDAVHIGYPLNVSRSDVVYDEETLEYKFNPPGSKWAFASALLFTISLITTVGYGHVFPSTQLGQGVCILYSLVGLPLMLLFLANVGEIMAHAFRILYGKGCCYFCWKKRKANYAYNRRKILQAQGKLSRSPSPKRRRGKDEGIDWAFLKTIDPDSIKEPKDDIVNVPVTLTLIVIGAYVLLGAVIFAELEDGWSWMTGAYFSFVTLSTIGFGDLKPGWDETGNAGILKMVGSSLYIVLGLAVLSMSFNLIIEELIAKFRWIGKKLGIIDDKKKAKEKEEKKKDRESPSEASGSDEDSNRGRKRR